MVKNKKIEIYYLNIGHPSNLDENSLKLWKRIYI